MKLLLKSKLISRNIFQAGSLMGKGIDKMKGMHDRPKAKKIAKLFEGFNAVNPSEGHVKLAT